MVTQQQVSKTIVSHQNLEVASQAQRDELERVIVDNKNDGTQQQSASALAMLNSRSSAMTPEDGPSATYHQMQQQLNSKASTTGTGPSTFIHSKGQSSYETTLVGNSIDLPPHH